jgi:hypothetical protein
VLDERPQRYVGRHARHRSLRRPTLRGAAAVATAVAAGAALLFAVPAGAADPPRIDLRVLVVTDGSAQVDALAAQLDREGVPYDSIDVRAAGRPPLTAASLTAGAGHGRYQGVVVPNDSPLPAAEAGALAPAARRGSGRAG